MRLLSFLLFSSILLGQNNWHPLNSPGGGNVNNLFKVNDTIFIAGCQTGDVFRSTDKGALWEKVITGTNGNANTGVREILFNVKKEIILSTFDKGILHSTDKGKTWTPPGGGGEYMGMNSAGFMIAADNVSSDNILEYSLDSGYTWIDLSHPWNSSVYDVTARGINFYIVAENKIYCTSDSGSNWNVVSNSPKQITDLLFINDAEIIAASTSGILYSPDTGHTWSERNNGISPVTSSFRRLYIDGGTVFACSNIGLFYTDDCGLNWKHYNNYNIQRNIRAILKAGTKILAATAEGVFEVLSTEWRNAFAGVYLFTPGLLSTGAHNELLYNTPSGFFRSDDQGLSWTLLNVFYNGVQSFSFQDSSYVVQGNDNYFYYSSDMGHSWSKRSYIQLTVCLQFSTKVKNRFYFSGLKYVSGQPPQTGFYYSPDGGTTLTNYDSGVAFDLLILPGDTLFFTRFSSTLAPLGIHLGIGLSPSRYFSFGVPGTDIGSYGYDRHRNVYAATTNSLFKLNWQSDIWNLVSNTYDIRNIIFDKYNYMYCLQDKKLEISLDGIHFFHASPPGYSGKIVRINIDSSGYYYAVTKDGAIFKTNSPSVLNTLPAASQLKSPANMASINPDSVEFIWGKSEPLTLKYSLEISSDSVFTSPTAYTVDSTSLNIFNLPSNKKLFWRVKAFNSFGWGSYSEAYSFTTFPGAVNEPLQILSYELAQNYPNPFNPSTKITFNIAKPGQVRLSVYNLLGQEVRCLVNEFRTAGKYNLEFNASSFSSGVYIYRLISGNYISERKMIIIK